MPDPNYYIRQHIRQAREEAGLSQIELAQQFGCSQVTMSDIELGVTKVNAGDLLRFASILNRSVLFFLPGVHSSDLTDREQTLVFLFRELDDSFQASLLETVRNQLTLYRQTKAIEAMPESEKQDAAYDLVVRFLEMQGLAVGSDEQGRPYIDGGEPKGFLQTKDEKDRQIIEELVRRLEKRSQ